MAFTRYLNGADPDPWTIYPMGTETSCDKDSPIDHTNPEKPTRWSCTREEHGGTFHVARAGSGALVATWDDADDEMEDGPHEVIDGDGKVVDRARKFKPDISEWKAGDKLSAVTDEEFKKRYPSKTTDLRTYFKPNTLANYVGPYSTDGYINVTGSVKDAKTVFHFLTGCFDNLSLLERKGKGSSEHSSEWKWSPEWKPKKGDKLRLISREESMKRSGNGSQAQAFAEGGEHGVKIGDVYEVLKEMEEGEDTVWMTVPDGTKHRFSTCAFEPAQETTQPKEKVKMADQGKIEKDKERAEIVYGEMVTFEVDGGKPIRIENETESMKWLQRRMEEREKEIVITENIDGAYPSDGMISLARVLRRDYGFMKFDAPTPWGVPVVFTIPVNPFGKTQDAPWGKFSIPGLEGFLQTQIVKDKTGQPIFSIAGKVKNRQKDMVKMLANRVREDLKLNSVYKGKAIKVEFPNFNKVAFDPSIHVPGFLDVGNAKRSKLIFSREVADAVETSIFTPIEFSAEVKAHVGTLKRGVLLGGKPGTGKTLAAYVTANLCEQNGWTFIYLASTADLAQAIHFAKMYQPAVIFAEDLDSIVNTYAEDSNRDEGTMQVLNTLDGIDSKSSDVMVVFTTNYPEKLPEAMTRPGRLDAIITVLPPDSDAVERLIRAYSNSMMEPTEDLTAVCQDLAGQIPAVIKEVVDRAKLVAIRHRSPGCVLQITAEDLLVAKNSMLNHLRMLNEKRALPPSDIEKAANIVAGHMVTAMGKALESRAAGGIANDATSKPGYLLNPKDPESSKVREVGNALPLPDGRQ